jgi:predicted metal-dependent HD superfamily phosphohydrolase
MRCRSCGHEAACDAHQIKQEWNDSWPFSRPVDALATLLPSTRFAAMWSALGANGPSLQALARLRDAYDEPHRAYHSASHIGACLALLDTREVAAGAEHPAEVEAALWYHDAIYDTRAKDNEEKSALLAIETLSAARVQPDAIARIADHVRATSDHGARSPDGQLVIDIDLSILGARQPIFDVFDAAIRQEYHWVAEADYRRGRAAVLQRFIDRSVIFHTPVLREMFEARARENLRRAIRRLKD